MSHTVKSRVAVQHLILSRLWICFLLWESFWQSIQLLGLAPVLGSFVSYYKIRYDEEVVVYFFFPVNSVTCGWVICHLNINKVEVLPQSDKKWREREVFLSVFWEGSSEGKHAVRYSRATARHFMNFLKNFCQQLLVFFVALLWLCSFFPIFHCWGPIPSTFGSLRNQRPAIGISLLLVLKAPVKVRRCIPSSYFHVTSRDRCCLHHMPVQMDMIQGNLWCPKIAFSEHLSGEKAVGWPGQLCCLSSAVLH